MRRIDWALLIGCIVSIFFTSFTEFQGQCAQVRDNVLRLHILAPSDAPGDQALKYRVRDALLVQAQEWLTPPMSKAEAAEQIRAHLPQIEAVVRAEIAASGRTDSVQAEIVRMYFDTRIYDGIAVPAGQYDAVRITLGAGAGQNWWCVMFPPLCVPAAAKDNTAEKGKEEESAPEEAQTADAMCALNAQPHYRVKFAVVEWAEKWKNTRNPPPVAENTPVCG